MRDLGLPRDHEGVGQVEAEEDDASGGRGDVGLGEQGREEEAEADGGQAVARHEGENHRRVGEHDHLAVL